MRVLIVEDSLTYGRLQTMRLINSPTTRFESHLVGSLEAALDHLANDKVDVVLLDLGLPDAHGAASVRAIHLAHPDLPIVVMTSTLDDEIHEAAKIAGATDITRKGTDSDETMELRLLAAAYRKAYARISQADPMAPVTRALVADIALHLRNGEGIIQDLRRRLADGEALDPAFLDQSLEHVQEALAPMQVPPDEDFLLQPVDPYEVLRTAADHVVTLSFAGEPGQILAQASTVQRAFGAILSTLYQAAGPVQIEACREDHTVVLHIAHPRAISMKREHPLLWTMANDLLALSTATLQADDTGFTLRFAAADLP